MTTSINERAARVFFFLCAGFVGVVAMLHDRAAPGMARR